MGVITSTGYQRDTLAQIRTDVEAVFKNAFGSSFVVDAETEQGQIVSSIIDYLDKQEDMNVYFSDSTNLNTATETDLDNLFYLANIPREEGTPSQVGTTITANSWGFTIPANTEFSLVRDSNIVFKNETAKTITSGDPTINLVSVENQNYNILLTDTFTPVEAIVEITNIDVDSYTDGTPAETDLAYLLRGKELRGNTRASGIERVYNNLFTVDNVVDVKILENTTSSASGGVDPHAIMCVVLGGDDTEIANMIFNSKDCGTGTSGAESEVITDFQGYNVTIEFERPTTSDIGWNMEYTNKDGYTLTSDDIVDITDRFETYMQGLKIGQAVSTSDILGLFIGHYYDKIIIDHNKLVESSVEVETATPATTEYFRDGAVSISET